ncbi:TolC family protein [Robiginitalea sp. M366]|uniref:TolC family protein n=1 Tax=Robiginitalea aestuariiviva TaxID=3036903 RepID=UPI00240DACD1|nr:TolC family protein [Robiginitalea aestuariiviva]MDG1571296.1 TolC family protein [Robiginitalea aestuariiviva]
MRNYIAFLLALTATLGYGQEPPAQFSLKEAVQYALDHNTNALNATRDLEDAQKQKWETIATGLPQISGLVTYQDQLKQPLFLLPGELSGGDPGTFTPVTFGPPQTTAATATLRQKIFDGSYIVGVQATQTFLKYSQNTKEKTDQQVRQSVVEAYGNALLARESVAILEKNIETVATNLFETRKLFENGLAEEEQVEQLQITHSGLENQLKNNQRLAEITLQMLNVLMGLPLQHPTELTQDLDDLAQQETQLALLESPFQLENNVDFKLVQNLNQQRELELKLAKSRALPTLNAFINYGKTATSSPFQFFDSETFSYETSVLGFDLNIPIFSSLGRSASTQRARIALDKAKSQLRETEKQLQLQLEKARTDYRLAIETYQTSKANLGLAERIENKNQIKYGEGLASSFELRQAQTQLYAAQQEYLQAMVNVINRKTALENILNPE